MFIYLTTKLNNIMRQKEQRGNDDSFDTFVTFGFQIGPISHSHMFTTVPIINNRCNLDE